MDIVVKLVIALHDLASWKHKACEEIVVETARICALLIDTESLVTIHHGRYVQKDHEDIYCDEHFFDLK
jgi:hypothetical protein